MDNFSSGIVIVSTDFTDALALFSEPDDDDCKHFVAAYYISVRIFLLLTFASCIGDGSFIVDITTTFFVASNF